MMQSSENRGGIDASRKAGLIAFAMAMIAGTQLVGCGGSYADQPTAKDKTVVEVNGEKKTFAMHTVRIGDRTFNMKLALTEQQREDGLGGMDNQKIGDGMLFVFPRAGVRGFWMKGCLVDIDIIFVSPTGRITAMHRMKAPPRPDTAESELPRYSSEYPAIIALEFQAGTADQLKLKPGDRLDLPIEDLKRRAR